MSLMALKNYPEEFKAGAVALYLSDPSMAYKQVAEDLGINRATLRNGQHPRPGDTLAASKEPAETPADSRLLGIEDLD